jgi:hypothetical protein
MRRAQLVTPFGVGAMSILVNGTSVITAGLDHWYKSNDQASVAIEEYAEHDWRLEERLGVREFRLPPDFRVNSGPGDRRNLRLTVPVLRFPRWCFCMYCKRLKLSTLTMRQSENCPDAKCALRKYKSRMSQVPFVTICPRGHLDDFPFDKWVHRSLAPSCPGPLRLISRGGGVLAGQFVLCENTSCKMERSLGGILDASRPAGGDEITTLTERLAPGERYECQGAQPWLDDAGRGCGESIRGALRAAGNVYFPKIESSIYLPRHEGAISAELHDLMRLPNVGPVLKVLRSAYGDSVTVTNLREALPYELFAPITDDQLTAAYRELFGVGELPPEPADDEHREVLTANDEWRFPEFKLLRETPQDDYLTANDPGIAPELAYALDRVRRVDIVRETRALRGFTRVRDGSLRLSDGKALLRRQSLPSPHDWLPAYVVKGEGIYLEMNAAMLREWERRQEVKDRADLIARRYGTAAHTRGLEDRTLSPRFVLLHTLAHLLINELVFSCGYSSASLRERLFVSEVGQRDMAGVLIYTAAGDSEGTMGGLVRMARPTNLRAVFAGALGSARWCSTDPVCMELGQAGQGPDSCNLAACHGCALLPETSCEEFNRFLDRGLVVGTFDDPSLGFFQDKVT